MTITNGRKGDDTALVLALAAGHSVADAAHSCGLGVATVYRRLRLTDFRARVLAARDDLLHQAVGRLAGVAVKAVETLAARLDSDNEVVSTKAAIAILDSLMSAYQLTEMTRRLE